MDSKGYEQESFGKEEEGGPEYLGEISGQEIKKKDLIDTKREIQTSEYCR